MDSPIDYSSYNLEELNSTLKFIDHKMHPQKVKEIEALIIKKSEALQDDIVENENTGVAIGGWLILIGFGIIVGPIKMLFSVFPIYWGLFTDGTWEAISIQSSEAYSPLLMSIILTELITNSVILIISIYIIYLFLSKLSSFPKWYAGLALFSVSFIILDANLITLIDPSSEVFSNDVVKELARSLFALLIFAPYLFISKRAKETFVH